MSSYSIVWLFPAQDPCAPLRNALLMVVALSLANVVKFFTKVESRQGIYAVALISLNFFMLGTLAYPSLPYVGRFASVVLWSIGGRTLKLFGFESLRMSNLELQQSIERTWLGFCAHLCLCCITVFICCFIKMECILLHIFSFRVRFSVSIFPGSFQCVMVGFGQHGVEFWAKLDCN